MHIVPSTTMGMAHMRIAQNTNDQPQLSCGKMQFKFTILRHVLNTHAPSTFSYAG